MPLIPTEETLFQEKLSTYDPTESDAEGPSLSELYGAYWETENIIGSWASQEAGLPDGKDDFNFNSLNYVTDEEAENEKLLSWLADADSPEEMAAVRKQWDREQKNRDTIAQGGFAGGLMAMPVMLADFTMLFPGAAAYKTFKTGASVLKGAAVTGSIAATEALVTEGGLHASQLQRTYGESALNVTAAGLMGAALGGSLAHVSGGQLKELESAMDYNARAAEGKNTVATDTPEIQELAQHMEAKDAGAAQRYFESGLEVEGKTGKLLAEYGSFDPLSASAVSPSQATRSISARMFEQTFANEGGLPTAMSTRVKTRVDGTRAKLETVSNTERIAFKKRMKKEGGKPMSKRDWNKAITRARIEGTEIPELRNAASAYNQAYRDHEAWLVDSGVLTKETVANLRKRHGDNYVNRVYDVPTIINRKDDFTELMVKMMRRQSQEAKAKYDADKLKLAELGKGAKGAEVDDLRKAIREYESDDFAHGRDENGFYEDSVYRDNADGIYARIVAGDPIPQDFTLGGGSKLNPEIKAIKGARGPLKNRTIDLSDKELVDYLTLDADELAQRNFQQTSWQAEMLEEFGTTDIDEILKAVDEDYIAKINKAQGNDKLLKRLHNRWDKDKLNLKSMFQRELGFYKPSAPGDPMTRLHNAARNINYLRMMGGVSITSVPDIGRIVAAEGMVKTFGTALNALTGGLKGIKMSAQEAELAGIGVEVLLGTRSKAFTEIDNLIIPNSSKFEEGLQKFADEYSNINLLNHWNNFAKKTHAVTMKNRLIPMLQKGEYDERLAQLGINKIDAELIGEQLRKHGGKEGKTFLDGASKWDDDNLALMWWSALRKESDRVIVVPGQEKPLFLSTQMGRTLGQFKSFLFSSTQKATYAGLQGQDKNFVGGMILASALSGMVYSLKEWAAGREIPDDPREFLINGFDRSGFGGYVMETGNLVERLTGFGVRSAAGIDPSVSRFAAKSTAEYFVGPSYNLLKDSLTVMQGVNGWDEQQTKAAIRMVPMNNLFYTDYTFKAIQEATE